MNAPNDRHRRAALARGTLPTLRTNTTPELIEELTLRIDVARAFVDDTEDENARRALGSLCGAFEVLLNLLKASRRFDRSE